MAAGQEKIESTNQAAAASVINAKIVASRKASGPQPVARTANLPPGTQSSRPPALARVVGSMQRNVGNARVGRMLGEQRKAEAGAPHGDTIHRKCACGGDAGAAGTCSECDVNRQVQPDLTSNTQTPAAGSADVSHAEEAAHREEETAAAGASTGTTKIQRFGWGDIADVMAGAAGVASPAAGAAAAMLRMIQMHRRVTSLRDRIERVRRAASLTGGLHFSDDQWTMLTASVRLLEATLPLAVPAFRLAAASLFRFGSGVYRVESVIALPAIIAVLLEALALLLILIFAFIILMMILPIIERIVDAIEEAVRNSTVCDAMLVQCLENPWQPDWNQDEFGKRKDCGACYRECKHAGGVWPSYKCPP